MALQESIDKVTGDMPLPSPSAIEAEAAKEQETRSLWGQLRDRAGRAFDTAIHKTDASGNPMQNADGTLRVKPGSGSPKAQMRRAEGQPSSTSTLVTERPYTPSPTETGRAIADSIFMLGITIGGDEWLPMRDEKLGIDEQAQAYYAWGRYCEARQIKDIPPGIAVVMCCASYVALRLNKPKTQARLQVAKEWLATKWAKWRVRKHGKGSKGVQGKVEKEADKAS